MFKKMLSFILIITSITPLFSEYILYKLDKNKNIIQLNQKEYAQAFGVLMKYQFPMNIPFFHETDKKKWTQEHYDLLKNEQSFIQKKLDQFGVKAAFIPKTLYELFFLQFYLDSLIKQKPSLSYALNKAHTPVTIITEYLLNNTHSKNIIEKWAKKDEIEKNIDLIKNPRKIIFMKI